MESSDVLNYLADASVRSLCLAVTAMVAIAAARMRSAPVKHAVWTAVMCAMLALPLLSMALPAIPLRVLQPSATLIELAPLPNYTAANVPGAAAVPAPAPRTYLPGWRAVAVSLYVLGAVCLLGRFALGYLLSRRLVKRSAPIDGAPVEVPGAALAESKAVSVPLTIGWLRPRILLPACWQEWDRAKLEAVLAHEAAHVARRDWLVGVLARLNTSLFWFHPLAWWMERKLAALAEDACDEASLLANGNRERYARLLLEMAQAVRAADGRLAWHTVEMARPSQVRRRVEAILDESRRLSRGMTKTRWAAVLLCVVPLAYGAAALRLEQAQVESKNPWTPGSYMDALSRGNHITPEEAQRLERYLQATFRGMEPLGSSPEQAQRLEGYLQANPEDLTARGSLVSYYFLNGIREPRLKHIFWLIEHHPESDFAGFNSAAISPKGGLLNSESDYSRARDLWLEQTRTRGNDPRVLVNAARFFTQPLSDFAMAADLFKRASLLKPDPSFTQHLAAIYVNVIIGALRPRGERFAGLPYEPALAERFKGELESSSNGMLLSTVGENLISTARREASPDLNPAIEFGERLVERAGQFGYRLVYPPSRGVAGGVGPGVPGGVGTQAQVVAVPNERPPQVLQRVPPVYPPLAKQARIQGTVRLRAEIGTDGKVVSMTVISGHPLLIPAAQESLQQWTFKPAEANGRPIQAATTVDVTFTLPPSETQASQGADTPRPMRIRVGGNVQMANLVNKVDPVYPPLALQARIQGTVRFNLTIDPEGLPKDIQLDSGHPLLVPAALEAVRQWVWKPTLLNGQPVEVLTTVEVPFTLPDAQ
jgi:TonB family protein